MAYIKVILIPKIPRSKIKAISLTKGEVIKKESVTPRGIPPFRNPIKTGIEEQLQKGLTALRIEVNKWRRPYGLLFSRKFLTLSIGQ